MLSMVRVGLLILLSVDLEPMRRNSILSLLTLRKLCCIQVLIADKQELTWERGGLWGVLSRDGHRLDFNDSDSNSDSSFRFRFLSILDSDSLSGGVETG